MREDRPAAAAASWSRPGLDRLLFAALLPANLGADVASSWRSDESVLVLRRSACPVDGVTDPPRWQALGSAAPGSAALRVALLI
ncbi:hypothetical protein GCM10009557_26310 [Virgisporangium ochraceum]|uniref:Uncharacterized protein n=1 Tax=Virgisporangium ochraceum TaxID=65505 RepID=A0A8J4EH54_9ACTN|nr:hypothetical protein [Virgisporangium ochraceum]GIJ75475.1 hypothetical protein Voc01_103920 [Virgisporangium ochraceum]